MNDVHSSLSEDPRWGTKNRASKASGILQTVSHFVPKSLADTNWLDVGCGNGEIAMNIALRVKSVAAVDPEAWRCWQKYENQVGNLKFYNNSGDNLPFLENSFDIVLCNQVYEHVANPIRLIDEIYRVLKPGGCCYFAGPNLLFPIEPHVMLPFVHWLPRKVVIYFMKSFRATNILDAYSSDYWTLLKWFRKFDVINAVTYIIKNPKLYNRSNFFWLTLAALPEIILEILVCLSPGFVFILKKPINIE